MEPPLLRDLRSSADPERAQVFQSFFQTGPGGYGAGDRFLGVTAPATRRVAKAYRDLPLQEVGEFLRHPYHEVRLTALHILVEQYQRGSPLAQEAILQFYLDHLDFVNNWDLVDTSAHKILGAHVLSTGDSTPLWELANSEHLWRQRASVVATLWLIKHGQLSETVELAEHFLTHPHDLMHKAVGWVLREVGKKDLRVLRRFLDSHAKVMPRTMLRYSLEKLSPEERQSYMQKHGTTPRSHSVSPERE